ncbi:hypothetical protein CPC08DRAFT_725385 [Agrocybe pediades]|nr:hypothetical protein CPC08DRAFT_725385 [Agrocybe pediades]
MAARLATQRQTNDKVLTHIIDGTLHERTKPKVVVALEFSSAFGLMSLDDPNVLAGLVADGQPFFSDPAQVHNQQQQGGQQQQQQQQQQNESGESRDGNDGYGKRNEGSGGPSALLGGDMDTPMPIKRSSGLLSAGLDLSGAGSGTGLSSRGNNPLPTPAREMDQREREFWKQYMRTPLTGPSSGLGDATTPSGQGNKGASSTTTPYRRQRVSSLPSVKTPIVELDQMYGAGADHQYHYYQQHQHQQHQHQQGGDGEQHGKLGPMSSIRTTLHGNAEDLRSYEAAVLARKAPALMNLQLKRPMKKSSDSSNFNARPKTAVEPKPDSQNQSQSQNQSSPTPSSLANAFGSYTNMKKEESASPSLSSNSHHSHSNAHSRESSAHEDSDADNRPSFKRLPSQTLGPANSKKPFYGYDDDDDRELVGWGTGVSDSNSNSSNPPPPPPPSAVTGASGGVVPKLGMAAHNLRGPMGISHPDRVVASLAERRKRRMSAPGSSLNLQSLPSPLPASVAKPVVLMESGTAASQGAAAAAK